MNIDTKETLGGHKVTITDGGYFQANGETAKTFADLRARYEASQVQAQEAKAKSKTKATTHLPVAVIDNGKIVPAIYRGKHGNTGSYLLTVDGEKVNSFDAHLTVLRPLSDDERNTHDDLRAESDALGRDENAVYEQGVLIKRWTTSTESNDHGWTVSLYPDGAKHTYQVDPVAKQRRKVWMLNGAVIEPFAAVAVTYDQESHSFTAPAIWLSSSSLDGLARDILAASHPHHGAEYIDNSGDVGIYDANSYATGVLTEGFDVEGYKAKVAARVAANKALHAWIAEHRFTHPA